MQPQSCRKSIQNQSLTSSRSSNRSGKQLAAEIASPCVTPASHIILVDSAIMSDTTRDEHREALQIPLLDLDDHRQLSASRPHAGSTSITRTRRGTFASIEEYTPNNGNRLDLAAADRAIIDSAARDFECAIADDDAGSVKQGASGVRRASTLHRSGNYSVKESPSHESLTSARGFNDKRRRHRSNTQMSGHPELDRTDSIGHGSHRRKLTFSEGAKEGSATSASTDTEAEEDVCYPDSDHPEQGGPEIDYEELEEYVAEEEETRTVPTTPAAPGKEAYKEPEKLTLPSPAITPSDDAFDELEKVTHRPLSATGRRASTVEVPKTIYQLWRTDYEDVTTATSLGGLLREGESFKDLFTTPEKGWWWLDVSRASKDEVNVLCKAFSVHRMTREDIVEEEYRDKVEMFNHYYFVAFRSFEDDPTDKEEYLEPIHYYAVVFRFGILTFCSASTPHPNRILRRIARLRDHMTIDADWIAYALVDDITDRYVPVIEELDKEVDTIEDQVYTARTEDAREILAQIGECRRRVMTLLRLLSGKPDVIKGFAKRCNPEYSMAPTSDVGQYLSDIQDHIITMRDNLTHSEQLLSRIHSNFLAQINIENINSGNKTNKMLGKVTLFASIFVPMNIITGLFGMNVKVPWGIQDGGNLASWFGIVGFIALFSVICVLFFKLKRLV